ncbi:hypothetical protein ACFQE1_19610 [Halobium palmae]|uniref:Uncharacterized protein n=1 Tax=Halobium palmae TaxID=1776492 RepID=A0ABD5S4D1_9EURY
MENRTIGDDLAEATISLENAIDNEQYDELPPSDQAYLQEALYFLNIVQSNAE